MQKNPVLRGLSLLPTKTAIQLCSGAIPHLRCHTKSRVHKRRACLRLILTLLLIVPASAQVYVPALDAGIPSLRPPSGQYLLGDWGGKRSALAEKGITFDFFYITDLQANPSGGLEQTQAGWERIRGTVDVNFDQFIRWQGLRFYATGVWQTGANLGAKIGTLANPSDLVSAPTTRLDSSGWSNSS